VLEAAEVKGPLPFQVFSITDRDNESDRVTGKTARAFTWNAYHIENYFLVPTYINRAIAMIQNTPLEDEEQIASDLMQCAADTMPQLVRHELSEHANIQLIKALDVKTSPLAVNQGDALAAAVGRSVERAVALQASELSVAKLSSMEIDVRDRLKNALEDGSWTRVFRGRDILRRFVSKRKLQPSYEVFRNIVLSQMRADGYRPDGMKVVVDEILQRTRASSN
jgi:hypothetical protein